MKCATLVVVLLTGCTQADPQVRDGAADGPATWAFKLDAGTFPAAPWPGVVVVVPSGFRVEKPVHVVIWLRGLWNCATNVVRDQNGECTKGGGVREAFQLTAQLEASGRNALLIVPELSFDPDSNDPGNLAVPGGFRALLAETLSHLAPLLGPIAIDDLAPVIVAAHSAGWRSSSAILEAGGVPVSEVWELDALYDGIPAYVNWIQFDLRGFIGPMPERRFTDIYTDETAANSLNMAETAEVDWLPNAGAVFDDRLPDEVPDDRLRVGLVFKRSGLSHLDVARVWLRRMLITSRVPPRTP